MDLDGDGKLAPYELKALLFPDQYADEQARRARRKQRAMKRAALKAEELQKKKSKPREKNDRPAGTVAWLRRELQIKGIGRSRLVASILVAFILVHPRSSSPPRRAGCARDGGGCAVWPGARCGGAAASSQ